MQNTTKKQMIQTHLPDNLTTKHLLAMHNLKSSCFNSTPEHYHYKSIEHLFLDAGENFVFDLHQTKIYSQMQIKQCFRNAYQLALDNPELDYVEGFATTDYGFTTLHAWNCLKTDNKVIDVTWRTTKNKLPDSYVGIRFPLSYVEQVVSENEVYGVVENYQQRFPLLRDRFSPDSLIK